MSISALCRETNRYVSPKYADKKSRYYCPQCTKQLVLCKGDIITPYFRHKMDLQPCKYYDHPSESQIHHDGKEQIRYWLLNGYSVTIERTCTCCNQIECFEIPGIDPDSNILLEYRFEYNGAKIADVCYLDKDDIVCIFEIYHTHKTKASDRPGLWFELDAMNIITYTSDGKDISLQCIRKERCQDCLDKAIKRELKRTNAINILYTWLKSTHIKPFDFFHDDRKYHSTEVLENEYFNIGIYEKEMDEEMEVDGKEYIEIRYKIRLCFDDEIPDFQKDCHLIDYDTLTGIYFVDVDWVCNQQIKPEFIRFEHSIDYFKNGYERNCTKKCKTSCDCKNICPYPYLCPYLYHYDYLCTYDRPFRVQFLNVHKQSYKVISIDNWCDIETYSEYIPCLLCENKNTPLSIMLTNKISTLCCKQCDIECFSNRICYFDVSYSRKDKFKELGGQWDYHKRKWYCYQDNLKLDEIQKDFQRL